MAVFVGYQVSAYMTIFLLVTTRIGHVLTCNLMNNADILRCSRDFCKQANCILFRYYPIVQTRLLLNYCMSLYGCAVWSLNLNT